MDPLLDPESPSAASAAELASVNEAKTRGNDSGLSERSRIRKCKQRSNHGGGNGKKKRSKHRKSRDKKKHKKHHKRKTKYSSSSSEECSSEEDEWVEKADGPAEEVSRNRDIFRLSSEKSHGPTVGDDMGMMLGMIPTYSNEKKKQKREDQKKADRQLSSIDRVGLHERELNPYWKDGGMGLPSDDVLAAKKSSELASSAPVGDGGLAWLRKSYQRAKEQAKEQGKSLEEVAEERWASLSTFYKLLEEAEDKANVLRSTPRDGREERFRSDNPHRKTTFKKPDSGSDEDDTRRSHRSAAYSKRPAPSHSASSSWRKQGSRGASPKAKALSPETPTKRLRTRSRSPLSHSHTHTKAPENVGPGRDSGETEAVEPAEPEPEVKVLTDKEMNELNAKIIKAELLSNAILVEQLRKKLTEAQQIRDEYIKTGKVAGMHEPATRVVTKLITDIGRRQKTHKRAETHKDGQRIRYFPDDDKHSLANMYQKERLNTVEDENALFSRLAGKGIKATEDYDVDDIFTDKASSSKNIQKEQEREIKKVLDEEKEYKRTLEDCSWCFEGRLAKNIVIAIGEKSFICVPPFQSLTEGHCLIVPMFHSVSSTSLDEDVWSEIQKFRQAIVKMFSDIDQDVVVFESAVFLKKYPHMVIECVPMPKEVGELAPIYFKKAIQECETEWSQNKKVVDLRGKDIRRGVPKGLPYFWVDFGMDSGFAHVIEDERYFPRNFAQEIIGGMLELDHQVWRKQKKDDFNTQKNKLIEFLKIWGPYDWTRDQST